VVLIFKRSDPVTYLLDTANYILCGVIYPVEVLPAPLQSLAKLLPATHALSALRAAGLSGAGIPSLLPAWGILAAFAALLWPAAAVALAAARRHLERTGTLPHG
jgi:ABC-2 type transport system permease protein